MINRNFSSTSRLGAETADAEDRYRVARERASARLSEKRNDRFVWRGIAEPEQQFAFTLELM
jgi:hypothetical protein